MSDLATFRALEVTSRRKVGGRVRHPDACPKLLIRGAAWAIPPRGIEVVPRFTGGRVTAEVAAAEAWPEADELLRLLPACDVEICSQCGQVVAGHLAVDPERHAQLFSCLFGLAARLLSSAVILALFAVLFWTLAMGPEERSSVFRVVGLKKGSK